MATTYLTHTHGSAATLSTKGTFSCWVKRSAVTGEQVIFTGNDSSNRDFVRFESSSILRTRGCAGAWDLQTTQVFRDANAWYHIVVSVDTTQSTDSNRIKVYVNGSQITSFSTSTYPSQNYALLGWSGNGKLQTLGRDGTNNAGYLDGTLSHVHWIDGTAYDASAFGETDSTTGHWTIKTGPSVTYGNSGFFVLRDGNSLTDESGNSNNFALAGGTLTKSQDCPDNVFATWNALAQNLSGITYSSGNTVATMTSDAGQRESISTLGMDTGKFYMECKLQAIGSTGGSYPYVGIVAQPKYGAGNYVGQFGTGWHPTGDIYNAGSNSASGTSYTTGDIIGVAVDVTNSKLYWHKNGTYISNGSGTGNPTTGANGYDISARTAEGTLGFAVSSWNNNGIWQVNFGDGYFGTTAVSSAGTNAAGVGIFEYDVPTGYTALSTKGLNI